MKKDLFKYIPSEISINILSRLPARTIAISKCVSKPWLHLLSSDDFVNSHLSKSVPSLAISISESAPYAYQVFEFEGEVDDIESHDFRSNQVTKFDFPATLAGAANGFLLLEKIGSRTDNDVFICNPLTREYVELTGPKEDLFRTGAYGFGASRISGQYKVVRINDKSECYVHTLGTGSWRRVGVEAVPRSLLYDLDFCYSVFVYGRLYWMVTVAESSLIGCFDLETECLSSFDAPAEDGELSVVRDRLCYCECGDEIVLWVMQNNGVEISWSKEHVFKKPICDGNDACPINVFKNGDMLMLWDYDQFLLFYDSKKIKAIHESFGIPAPDDSMENSIEHRAFTLSFLSLKGLGMENVISF